MKLSGIELRYFRSIGAEPVVLNPMKKCNILVGQNNAGKSNVLKAIGKISERLQTPGKPGIITDIDDFQRSRGNKFTSRVFYDADPDIEIDNLLTKNVDASQFWFDLVLDKTGSPLIADNIFAGIRDWDKANSTLQALTGNRWSQHASPEEIKKEFIAKGTHIFNTQFAPHLPKVYIVPEFRQIKQGEAYSYDGTDLVNLLARFQLPEIGKDKTCY